MPKHPLPAQYFVVVAVSVVSLAMWSCRTDQPDESAANETPESVREEMSEEDREEAELLEEFEVLADVFAGSSRTVRLKIFEEENGQTPLQCRRRIETQPWYAPIYPPGQAIWRVIQERKGLWMEGDQIVIERKPWIPDPCFALEPFWLNYPTRAVPSGPPLESCQVQQLPGHQWYYCVTLLNGNCETNEDKLIQGCPSHYEGIVGQWDPVVIIETG